MRHIALRNGFRGTQRNRRGERGFTVDGKRLRACRRRDHKRKSADRNTHDNAEHEKLTYKGSEAFEWKQNEESPHEVPRRFVKAPMKSGKTVASRHAFDSIFERHRAAIAERRDAGGGAVRLFHDHDRAGAVFRREARDDTGALFVRGCAEPLEVTVLLFKKKCVHDASG